MAGAAQRGLRLASRPSPSPPSSPSSPSSSFPFLPSAPPGAKMRMEEPEEPPGLPAARLLGSRHSIRREVSDEAEGPGCLRGRWRRGGSGLTHFWRPVRRRMADSLSSRRRRRPLWHDPMARGRPTSAWVGSGAVSFSSGRRSGAPVLDLSEAGRVVRVQGSGSGLGAAFCAEVGRLRQAGAGGFQAAAGGLAGGGSLGGSHSGATCSYRCSEVFQIQDFQPASVEDIARVHSQSYVYGLEKVSSTT